MYVCPLSALYKDIILLTSVLLDFWDCSSYLCSSACNIFFPHLLSSIFFILFCIVFSSLNISGFCSIYLVFEYIFYMVISELLSVSLFQGFQLYKCSSLSPSQQNFEVTCYLKLLRLVEKNV